MKPSPRETIGPYWFGQIPPPRARWFSWLRTLVLSSSTKILTCHFPHTIHITMMLSRSLRMKTRTIPGSRTRTLINKKFLCAATTTEVATTASEKMFTDEQYAAAIAKAAAEIKDAKLEVTTTNEEGSDVTATPKTRVFTDEPRLWR